MSLERFRKVFSLLPEAERKLPIIVINDRKISWEDAYKEIKEDTHLGTEIQKRLEDLNII